MTWPTMFFWRVTKEKFAKIESPFIIEKNAYEVSLKLLKKARSDQKADIAKSTYPTKMGAIPAIIFMFVGTATSKVLKMTLRLGEWAM